MPIARCKSERLEAMGSKPSVPREEGTDENPPVRQKPQRRHHHFGDHADGPVDARI